MRRFTVRQAAEYLGVSAALVYALCTGKKIRHERIGIGRGRILIPEDALEDYRLGRTVTVAQPVPAPKPLRLRHLDL
jgi:excisionase family DNA binding protein